MRPACLVQEGLNTRQKDVGEHFAGDREERYWSGAASVCLGALPFVQCDYDAILPSHGIRHVLQTNRNMKWSARATGIIANLSSSAGMPSGPGA